MRSPIVLFFSISIGIFPTTANAVEYDMPNQGSPYVDLSQITNGSIVHLPTGVKVDFEQLIDALSGSRVIYIGETHDNMAAHEVQLKILRALERRFSGSLAVGMEMFRRSAQNKLEQWREGSLSNHEFKKLFYKHWGGNYQLYQGIFEYILEKQLPLLGLKSTTEMQARFKKEWESNPGVFPKLNLNDPYHKSHSRSIFGGHSDHGPKYDPYPILVLWEETMAETVAEFLQNPKYKSWKLVVIAGGFHIQYGFGIPKRAFRRTPHAYSIVLPTVTEIPPELDDRLMDVKSVPIPLYAADFAWKLPYEILPETKAKLGVFLEELDEGLLVKSVKEYSNAERAGILEGDVLLLLEGQPITGSDDLISHLQEIVPGGQALFRIYRAGSEMDIKVIFRE